MTHFRKLKAVHGVAFLYSQHLGGGCRMGKLRAFPYHIASLRLVGLHETLSLKTVLLKAYGFGLLCT